MTHEQLAREYGEACQRNLAKDEQIERLRAEVEALRPDAEKWRAQERDAALAKAKAERQSAFDTLPDDFETGDW